MKIQIDDRLARIVTGVYPYRISAFEEGARGCITYSAMVDKTDSSAEPVWVEAESFRELCVLLCQSRYAKFNPAYNYWAPHGLKSNDGRMATIQSRYDPYAKSITQERRKDYTPKRVLKHR